MGAEGTTPATLGAVGGEVVLQPTRDEWRDGISYAASLYEDGLIDEAAFTQNGEALSAKGNSAEGVILGSVAFMHPWFVDLDNEDGALTQYDAVAAADRAERQRRDLHRRRRRCRAGATFVITNRSSEAKQQKLMQIIDFIVSYDGHLQGEFGVEGVNWVRPEEGDVALDETLEPNFKVLGRPRARA